MMGNVWEWTEGPFGSDGYLPGSRHRVRGGSCTSIEISLTSSFYYYYYPYDEKDIAGFRVASVPEPATITLMALPAVLLLRKRTK